MQGYEPQAYGEAMAEVYDDWYADISDADATVAAVVELVRAAGGGPVLELGVGTGRLALPLAAAGLDVTGIDVSAAMLDRLRAKPGERGHHGRARRHGRPVCRTARSPWCSWPSTRSSA